MSNYRRWRAEGGTFFFTVVTYERRPVLGEANARRCLREAIDSVKSRLEFHIVAVVLLPDHFHMIMELPPNDDDDSTRLKRIRQQVCGIERNSAVSIGFDEPPVRTRCRIYNLIRPGLARFLKRLL